MFEDVLSVNVTGTMRCCTLARDKLRAAAMRGGGVIVNTASVQDDPVRSEAILARPPLGRWAEPQGIAGAAVFLCSPAAPFITGTIVRIDGGYLAA